MSGPIEKGGVPPEDGGGAFCCCGGGGGGGDPGGGGPGGGSGGGDPGGPGGGGSLGPGGGPDPGSPGGPGSSSRFPPVALVPSISYPTYQLFALAGLDQPSSEDVFKMVILETADWLRQRFRMQKHIPPELMLPAPSDHRQLDLGDLRSSSVDYGFKLEIVWLPDETAWCLRLTEPDMGVAADTQGNQPGRLPVPGRLFETNVAFRLVNGQVECAFKTIVSEPEGTLEPAETFRITPVKTIARNPDIGLWQGGFKLLDQAHRIDSGKELKALHAYLSDKQRTLPALIVTEMDSSERDTSANAPTSRQLPASQPRWLSEAPKARLTPLLPDWDVDKNAAADSAEDAAAEPDADKLSPSDAPEAEAAADSEGTPDAEAPDPSGTLGAGTPGTPGMTAAVLEMLKANAPAEPGSPTISSQPGPEPPRLPGDAAQQPPRLPGDGSSPFDLLGLAPPPLPDPVEILSRRWRYWLGWAQSFVVSEALTDELSRRLNQPFEPGTVCLLSPKAASAATDQEATLFGHRELGTQAYESLAEQVKASPNRTDYYFGSCIFADEAQEVERQHNQSRFASAEEMAKGYEQQLAAERKKASQEQASLRQEIADKEEKAAEYKSRIKELEARLDELEGLELSLMAGKNLELERYRLAVEWFQSRITLPQKSEELPDWVEASFAGRLIFHDRAAREVKAENLDEKKLRLICDALDYLAYEYRDMLLGSIDEQECMMRCSLKYQRPFEVVIDNSTSLEKYSRDYKIKYRLADSRAKEAALDRHLKVGTDSQFLVRVYFLWDKERQLVVVGSLPNHLPTVTFN